MWIAKGFILCSLAYGIGCHWMRTFLGAAVDIMKKYDQDGRVLLYPLLT